MEYQKIINLSDNTQNQPFKFKTKNWDEINDESGETYNKDYQIRFKTSMLRSSQFNYDDSNTLVQGTIAVAPAITLAPISYKIGNI